MSESFASFNRLTNALELFKILQADDGVAFDEHFADILAQEQEPNFGVQAQLLSAFEERRNENAQELAYQASTTALFPKSFALLHSFATTLGKDAFVERVIAAQQSPTGSSLLSDDLKGIGEEDMRQWQKFFLEDHVVRLPVLFDEGLLEEISAQVKRAAFETFSHGKLGYDYTMRGNITQAMLSALLSQEKLVHIIEKVTGLAQGSVLKLNARVYEMRQRRDADGWHSDVDYQNRRVVAFGLNLQKEAVQGGELLLKRPWSLRKLGRFPVSAFGELTIFRIAQGLRHKVSPVQGDVPRLYCVGWYGATEDFDYDAWVERKI
ncbi:MAG: 2OG-Fe(II) oxygenase [Myxococcota bacterium]|jgi:hypothetical protein|nr:2OG-Fe(II) oxygenase [Myxococcota bacterium]